MHYQAMAKHENVCIFPATSHNAESLARQYLPHSGGDKVPMILLHLCCYVHHCTINCTRKRHRVSRKKTDTIIFCHNSENEHSTFKNGTCLYSQKHGKTDDRWYDVACTPSGQSRQLFKVDARCEPRSFHAHLRRRNGPTTPLSCLMVIQAVTFWA